MSIVKVVLMWLVTDSLLNIFWLQWGAETFLCQQMPQRWFRAEAGSCHKPQCCLIGSLHKPFPRQLCHLNTAHPWTIWEAFTHKDRVANAPKNYFFPAILKPHLKFLSQNGKHGCIFFAVQGAFFSQCIKMYTIICYNLSQYHTVPSLCPGFSSDGFDLTLVCDCCEQWVHSQARLLCGAELLP